MRPFRRAGRGHEGRKGREFSRRAERGQEAYQKGEGGVERPSQTAGTGL